MGDQSNGALWILANVTELQSSSQELEAMAGFPQRSVEQSSGDCHSEFLMLG